VWKQGTTITDFHSAESRLQSFFCDGTSELESGTELKTSLTPSRPRLHPSPRRYISQGLLLYCCVKEKTQSGSNKKLICTPRAMLLD
jgi:hypothetical protein